MMALSGASRNISVLQFYLTDLWNLTGDPRTADYPLMSTFTFPLSIFALYLFTVLYLGPRFMHNRAPFSLRWILLFYNFLLSFANLYFFLQVLFVFDFGWKLLDVTFQSTDDTGAAAMAKIQVSYAYMLSKYVDKLDTVFFILRKKERQITGLHVYHHAMVPLLGWTYLRTNAFHVLAWAFALLNTPVHTFVYAYYGLAALGPRMKPYLAPWKPYITLLEIAHFILLFAYGLYFCLNQKGYSPLWSADVLLQSSLYLVLFTRFYMKAYSSKKEKTA